MRFLMIGVVVAFVLFVGGWVVLQQVNHDSEQKVSQNIESVVGVTEGVSGSHVDGESGASEASAATVSTTEHTHTIDIHSIPLGDGKVSISPKAGYVYSCQTSFRGGGAEHAGDWIEGDTWDLSKKITVQGSVSLPEATFSTYLEGLKRLLKGNGLPVGSLTGIFPIGKTDLAYQYDRNPNSIRAYTLSTLIPADPEIAASPSCVPMGAIGYALNGVAIYNALDDAGRDAVAHEVQDSCDGHPQGAGQYHYHGPSDCMPHADENNALVGYALDGFGIYSRYDVNGKEYTNDDLDECHGITSEVEWNGKTVNIYHYVLTQEYPYTLGCYRGTPVKVSGARNSQQTGGSTGEKMPPQEAITACTGKTSDASCNFSGGQGTVSGTCRTTPSGSFACVPQ